MIDLPRRIRRGLIEASCQVRPARPRSSALPRRIRRGLIEAWRSARRSGRSPRSFRGEFAAASLKRLGRAGDDEAVVVLPRRIRRGLIEAWTPAGRRRAWTGPFRGEFAAASLKHVEGAGRGRPGSAFRGEFAAASLKPGLMLRARVADGVVLPRRIRRGLIEAPRLTVIWSPPPAAFRGEFAAASLKRLEVQVGDIRHPRPSAANSPRPH